MGDILLGCYNFKYFIDMVGVLEISDIFFDER